MPYLYQDSKPRPPVLPGTARVTHSSGKAYQELKQECLRKGVLFEDPDFPACNSSLFFSEEPPIPFIWKRPRVSMPLCFPLSSHQNSECALGSLQTHGLFKEMQRAGVTLPTLGAAAWDGDVSHRELEQQGWKVHPMV